MAVDGLPRVEFDATYGALRERCWCCVAAPGGSLAGFRMEESQWTWKRSGFSGKSHG